MTLVNQSASHVRSSIRAVLLFLCVLLGVGLLGLLALAILFWQTYPFDDRKFDADVWATVRGQKRALMADDLIANYLQAGTPEFQVRQLLGQPEKVYDERRCDYGGNALSGSYTLSYYIGSWSFEYRDSVFVYVHFNDDRCVFFAEIQGY